MHMCSATLEPFTENHNFFVFGFGDRETKDKGLFSFRADGQPCHGFEEVLERYQEITANVQMFGPTSFAPCIYAALNVVACFCLCTCYTRTIDTVMRAYCRYDSLAGTTFSLLFVMAKSIE